MTTDNYHKFSSYANRQDENNSQTVVVVEQKAPTDESIRLYKELYEKALENVIVNETVEKNDLKFSYTVITEGIFPHNHYALILKIMINGQLYTFKETLPSITKRASLFEDDNGVWKQNYTYSVGEKTNLPSKEILKETIINLIGSAIIKNIFEFNPQQAKNLNSDVENMIKEL